MRRLIAAALVLLGLTAQVSAANRFWVPLTVTGAISGTGGLCRLTVNDTTNLSAGIAVIVANILGATACDGTTTVTTVVDATHVEVNLSFVLPYTSGGTLAGGLWTSTGTGNWATSSGGAGGASVPGAADFALFNANSGTGSTIIPNYNISLIGIDMTISTVTLDFSVNNNNVTLDSGGFSGSGSSTRGLKMGNGTWTFTTSGIIWDMSVTSGLTFQSNSSSIVLASVATSLRTFKGGALTYNNLTTQGGQSPINITGNNTFTTLAISGPTEVEFTSGNTQTVTNAISWLGTASAQILIKGINTGSSATINSANNGTMAWTSFRDVTFGGGGTFTATNSFSYGAVSGVTITNPSAGGGGGGCITSGWLLWRDFDTKHMNDNFPAWLEKVA